MLFRPYYYIPTVSAVAATSYTDNVLALSPTAFWTMQDSSGNLADATGNGWAGTAAGTPTYSVTGPTINGESFDAITFDGTSAYFSVSSTLTDPSTDGFTISAWVKHPPEAAVRTIFWWLSGAEGTLILRKASGFGVVGATYDTSQSATMVTSIAADLDDTWTHVALRRDASPNLKIYQGTSTNTDTTETGTWKRDGNPNCYIGAQNTTPTDPWNGEMALVAYWNSPLTDAQMTSLRTGVF